MKQIVEIRIEQELDKPNLEAYMNLSNEEKQAVLDEVKNEIKKLFMSEGVEDENNFKILEVYVDGDTE